VKDKKKEDRKNKCVRQDRKIEKGVKKPKRKKAESKLHFPMNALQAYTI
jgi:hypothetical protein